MHQISVSLVYATAAKQFLYETTVPRGTLAHELITQSEFLLDITDLADQTVERLTIGVYGHKVVLDHLLEEGDRVEIYRPLVADPKQVRRQLALMGKTMGKK